MASKGMMPAIKSMLPVKLRSSLGDARRGVRNAFRAARKRMARADLYRLDTPERVGVVFTAPSDMRIDERLFLYSFIRGLKPERALEIGVARGGSAAIITNAMEDNGAGRLVGIDPTPDLRIEMKHLHGRYTLLTEYSPQAIPAAREASGAPFNFVLIDGLHMYDQVKKDIAGVLPHLAEGAYVLFHDAFHYGVATAIREAVEAGDTRGDTLVDCGYLCRTANVYNDPWTPYNGFRLLRRASAADAKVVDVEQVADPLYAAAGRPRPPLRRDSLNHDGWFCRMVSPCERCRAEERAGNGSPAERFAKREAEAAAKSSSHP
jgi:predicted O-methyltransferase YrrM